MNISGKNFVYRKKFGYKHGLLGPLASKQESKQRLLAYRWPRRISRIRRKRIISEIISRAPQRQKAHLQRSTMRSTACPY